MKPGHRNPFDLLSSLPIQSGEQCPSVSDLHALAENCLDPEQQESIKSHLEHCEECLLYVSQLRIWNARSHRSGSSQYHDYARKFFIREVASKTVVFKRRLAWASVPILIFLVVFVIFNPFHSLNDSISTEPPKIILRGGDKELKWLKIAEMLDYSQSSYPRLTLLQKKFFLLKYLDAKSVDSDGWFSLAETYALLGEKEKAISCFQKAQIPKPDEKADSYIPVTSSSEPLIAQVNFYQVMTSGDKEILANEKSLHSGDILAIQVTPSKHCFLYIFTIDTENRGSWLFPAVESLIAEVRPEKGYYEEFRLNDVSGEEKFFIVLSAIPAQDLEYFITENRLETDIVISRIAEKGQLNVQSVDSIVKCQSSTGEGYYLFRIQHR